MLDCFETISAPQRHSLKIQRSEFIGVAFPIENDDAFFPQLTALQKEYFDATHHCWAFRLFEEGEIRGRSSDAGEPSGTAGKPILNAMVSAELANLGVVVVRYYGGVKLGTGGLARAYRDAAQAVLGDVARERRYLYEPIEVEVPFHHLSTAYRLVAPPDIVLRSEEFAEKNVFRFDVRRSAVARFRAELERLQLLVC